MRFLHITSYLLLVFLATTTFSEVVWNKPDNWNNGLPSSIEVFQTNSSFTPGLPMTAAYSMIDLSDPDLELKVVHSEGERMKTPLEYLKAEKNLVYVAVNGGYFDMKTNISISVIVSDGNVIAGGQTFFEEKYKDKQIPYYPTRGVFGIYADNTMEIQWAYNVNNKSDIYAYPQASPNCYDCPPQFIPSKTFPSNGKPWSVNQSVGAGPVMMKDGNVIVDKTASEELFYRPGDDTRNPRTGICITEDNKLIIIVVDGRYDLSGGLYIKELGDLMQELKCKDALNLDGGGSTAMIVNGFITNRPSDASGMRHVTSAVLIVSRTKPNPFYEEHLEEVIEEIFEDVIGRNKRSSFFTDII